MAFDVAIAYLAMIKGVPLPYVVTILCTRFSSHVSGDGFVVGLGFGILDCQVALGPFVQHVEAPGTRPGRAAVQEILPDCQRKSAIEPRLQRGRPIPQPDRHTFA